MTTALLYVGAATIAAGSYALYPVVTARNKKRWQDATKNEVSNLLGIIGNNNMKSKPIIINTPPLPLTEDDLPPPVARHIQKALQLPSMSSPVQPMIKSLHMEQSGNFLLNNQWIPFTATQEFSAFNTNPGLVWDATMRLPLPWILPGSMSINVRDAYVDGRGTMIGKMMGFVTIVNEKDTPTLNEGELSRWLGECPVIPTALLPSRHKERGASSTGACTLQWKKWDVKHDANRATAILTTENNPSTDKQRIQIEIEFRFDEKSGLISSIHAMRPYCPPGSKEVMVLPWEGHFSDYQIRQGILVPTSCEVGWWKEDNPSMLELYFKARNTKFEFQFA